MTTLRRNAGAAFRRMRLAACGLLGLLPGLLLGQARAQAPDVTPMLRVETGVHQAVINRMIMLPDGKSIATVSDDKTARIWSADELKPLGTILPPLGTGDDGVLDAVAASGRLLALGGRIRYGDQFGVQFYRVADLKLIGHRSDLPAPVSALRFSADGHVLAVGMVGGRGIAFLDMSNGSQVGADIAYAGQVQWIDSDAQGRMVATGEDGHIRLYGADHRKAADATLPNGQKPYAVAFSPDGKSIAVGVQNSPVVWLLDAATLHRGRNFAGAAGRVGGFDAVAFSADGASVVGAGSYKASNDAPRLVRRWSLDGKAVSEFPAGRDTITDLLPVAGDVLVSDAEPVLARFDEGGHLRMSRAARHFDFRDAGLAGFGVSADGSMVELPAPPDAAKDAVKLVFDARQRSFGPATGGLSRPGDHVGKVQVAQWRNSATPKFNGRAIALDRDEVALATAVEPNGSGAALGTNFYVRFLRADGTAWQQVVSSPAWAVNVSGDGRLVIAGLGDGTLRWFDAATSNEILEVFIDPASRHWVMSTPEGFFDHDLAPPGQPDGRNLLGYRFNDPAAQISRFVEISQFYPVFYRPDLVGQALSRDPVARQTIQVAHEHQGPVQMVIGRGLPPTVTLVDVCGQAERGQGGCPAFHPNDGPPPGGHPEVKLTTTAEALVVRYQVVSQDADPGRVAVYRDGAVIAPAVATIGKSDRTRQEEAVIPLGTGLNTIRLLPVAASGQVEGSDAAAVQFAVLRTQPAPAAPPPVAPTDPVRPVAPVPPVAVAGDQPKSAQTGSTLYLLSVGVSRFGHAELNLDNASNDARSVATLMNGSDSPVYDRSVVTALYDDEATSAAIVAALKKIVAAARPDDLVIIFFAGHGEEVDGHYYFAPSDLGMHDKELFNRAIHGSGGQAAIDQVFRAEGLGSDQLVPLIQGLTATHVLMVLDTCYSGSIATQDAVFRSDVNTTVANSLGHASGRLILSSATTLALDSSDAAGATASDGQGHGLFTSFLLEALNGRADLMHSGRVNVVQLADYTISNVERATADQQQKQSPKFFFAGSEFFAVRTDK